MCLVCLALCGILLVQEPWLGQIPHCQGRLGLLGGRWGRGIGQGTLPPTLWYGTIVAGPMCVPLYVGHHPERCEHSIAVPSPGGPYALLASGGWCPRDWAVLPVGVALCTMLALL